MTSAECLWHRPNVVEIADKDSAAAQSFRERLIKPALLNAYFLTKLPLAAMAGLKVIQLDGEICQVTVPYGWRTQNPFGSIYFAALTMAGELSCAGLALMAARASSTPLSVLPVGLEGKFAKKATKLTTFECTEGSLLFDAANDALRSGQGVTHATKTEGRMPDGTLVASFVFTWSFKRRTPR